MKNLKIMYVDFENSFQIIKNNIYACKTTMIDVKHAKYHHNSSYSKIPNIIKNGILSYEEKMKLENRHISKEEMLKYQEDYHVNGSQNISLASMDIDYNTLSKDEWLYEPYQSDKIDLLISNDVHAYRNSRNYANEFLASQKIEPRYLKSIDIRILKLLEDKTIQFKDDSKILRIKKMLKKYNILRDIAECLIEAELNIPIREMSFEYITLDPQKVKKLPVLVMRN